MDYLLLQLTTIVLAISTVMLVSEILKSKRALKKYESIINIEKEVNRLHSVSTQLAKDIESRKVKFEKQYNEAKVIYERLSKELALYRENIENL